MEKEDRGETSLKTFNTAKVFAEEILFPLMANFKKFQRFANYGADSIEKSLELSKELKDIQRFNGIKGMSETCYDLLNAISSTVRLKNNKEEIKQLNQLVELIQKLISIFYENKDKFFEEKVEDMSAIEVLERDYFNKIKKLIDTCYINTEILMTRNKLLFADARDEFKSDEEIMDEIKREYIEA